MIARRYTCTLAALVIAGTCASASAQDKGGSPLQGLQMNKDQPVKIESATLEVRDKQRQATFAGGVKLTQGDTTLKCATLVVFYEDTAVSPQAKKGAAPAQAAGPGGGNQQIKRAEARGDVFVTQKDQTASGENGVFDLKANTVTLTGNVVVTQGQSVMRGERMIVELNSGVVRVEAGKGGGPVQMLVTPGAANAPMGAPKDAKQNPAPAQPSAKAPSRQPIKIN